ncbi:hypothetical protein G3N95_29930 [Paraburkholderia sp. Tr-20389]|uniref:hypothetical protein n=1 Tax=Paraburkholderia sp. Tr-20389 TaxID=2703903 RepID=UPI00197D9D76|nr:hypothetical protein [Paraburkholderia sp. Tr-20389]MBN3757194.1 hypothetical protein [Paraburkholderia sp. Tr-20389]
MRPVWTAEEDAIVREIYSTGKPIKCGLDRLPGRSWDAVKTRAYRLGVRRYEAKSWTDAEIKILKKIWKQSGSIKSLSRKLPNRTYYAISEQAKRIGLPSGAHGNDQYLSWVDNLVTQFLEKGGAFTANEIADHTGASPRQVRVMLKRGKGKKFHIDSWRMVDHARVMVWAHGKCADEARPEPQTKSDECKAWRAKQTRKNSRNPFAVLMSQIGVSNVVEIDNSVRGRVYQQSMSIKDDEELAA